MVIGHEALGEVVDAGSGISGLAHGDLAALSVRRPCPHDPCGPCRKSRQDFCITGDFAERGIKGAHGYMTEFVVDDERHIVKVPKELREAAVLLEPLTTWVYSMDKEDSPNLRIVSAIGARFVSSAEHPPEDLARIVGNISLVYEATGAAKVSFDVMSVLGVNGVFIFTGVPGVKAPIEVDAERIMRSLVLNNQVICGTVNAGRASFEEGVEDLVSFMRRFPDAVLSRGGIKSVITVA